MTLNVNQPKPVQPGLTSFDRVCLDRLLKAGHIATAVKLYRSVCRCSVEEAELRIKELSKLQISA